MRKAPDDPKIGSQKVTNTDEQEVVINHSTVQEGGYDEPTNQQGEQPPPEKLLTKEEKAIVEESRPRTGKKTHPGADGKRPSEEEAE